MLTEIGFVALFGYLLGSVPFGLLVARVRGVDIRKVGSGNIGATNVLRTLGKPAGFLTFGLDFCKGLLPVLLAGWLIGPEHPQRDQLAWAQLAGGGAAILGHSFSMFLNFTGGKGVATGAGVVCGLAWPLAWIGLGVWMACLMLTRFVSVASMAAALAVAGASWWVVESGPVVPVALSVLAALVVVRHRANLRRLAAGTEPKVFQRKTSTS